MACLPRRALARCSISPARPRARDQGRSRSELIREALRTLLSEGHGNRRSWTEALAPLKELEQQWVGRATPAKTVADTSVLIHSRCTSRLFSSTRLGTCSRSHSSSGPPPFTRRHPALTGRQARFWSAARWGAPRPDSRPRNRFVLSVTSEPVPKAPRRGIDRRDFNARGRRVGCGCIASAKTGAGGGS